jgi:hypothetical protein
MVVHDQYAVHKNFYLILDLNNKPPLSLEGCDCPALLSAALPDTG